MGMSNEDYSDQRSEKDLLREIADSLKKLSEGKTPAIRSTPIKPASVGGFKFSLMFEPILPKIEDKLRGDSEE